MIYTNKHNLSKLNYEWLKEDDYEKGAEGSVSATDLIKPVKEVVLFERYKDRIAIDVTDLTNVRLGKAMARDRARTRYDGLINERRVEIEIDGIILSGRFDSIDLVKNSHLLNRGNIENSYYLDDLKVTMVWNVDNMINIEEWTSQLSIYQFILVVKGGIKIGNTGVISAFMKDWKWNQHHKKHPSQLEEIPIELYTIEHTRDNIIIPKIKKIKEAREMDDLELPPCTKEETWHGRKCKKYCWARTVCDYGTQLNIDVF